MSHSRKHSLPRRSFLRVTGAGAALGAAASIQPGHWWGASRARAQAAKPKLIIVASSSGHLVGPSGDAARGYGGWLPRSLQSGTGEREVSTTADALPDILSPLEPHADQMLAIDGLRGSGVGAHQQSTVMLTGGGILNDEAPRASGGDGEFFADSPSIDHAIASALGSRVLGLSFKIDGFNLGEGYLSHTRPGEAFLPIQNHVTAHERVFGGISTEPADTRADRRRRVLQVVEADARRLRDQLPAADSAVIDRHLRSVAAIGNDFSNVPSANSCVVPSAPEAFDVGNPFNFPRLMRSFNQTMVGALACGYTQVGFIQGGNLAGSMKPKWDEFGVNSNFNEHAIAHAFSGQEGAGSENLPRAEAIRLAVSLGQAYSSLIAELLTMLENTMDVDGHPMLRNTIVLHVKPMGLNHNRDHLFWQLYGGQNLGVRTGRFLRLSRENGEAHYINDLHVAIARAMGVDLQQFGAPSQNRRPIAL